MCSSEYSTHKKSVKKLSLADFTDILQKGHKKKTRITFTAQGGSMAPFIKNQDILTISLGPFEPAIGSVVAHIDKEKKKVLIHRIVARKMKSYLLKGDNLKHFDGIMPKESLAGYVCQIKRSNKIVNFGLGQEKVFIAFLSRSGFLFYILRLLRTVKKKVATIIK